MKFSDFVSWPVFLAHNFVKTDCWVFFHQTEILQNDSSLSFQIFESSKFSKSSTFVKWGLEVVFHQTCGLQNEQSLLFQVFEDSDFCRRYVWVVFYQVGGYKMSKVCFSSFSNLQRLQTEIFCCCQKMVLGNFSPNGRLTKCAKFYFSNLWNFRTLKNPTVLLSKDVFE